MSTCEHLTDEKCKFGLLETVDDIKKRCNEGNCIGYNIDVAYSEGSLSSFNFRKDKELGDNEIGS